MRSDELFPAATGTGAVHGPSAPIPARPVTHDDPFARQAGPDVVINFGGADVRVYTHFSVDPESHEVKVAIVDQAGRLLRMIPPRSVAEMIQAMNSYGG